MSYPIFALLAAGRSSVSVSYSPLDQWKPNQTEQRQATATLNSRASSTEVKEPSYYYPPSKPQSTITSSTLNFRICFPNELDFKNKIKELYKKMKEANQVAIYSAEGRIRPKVKEIRKKIGDLHRELDLVLRGSTRFDTPCAGYDLRVGIENLNGKLDDFMREEKTRPRRWKKSKKVVNFEPPRRRLFF